jgi:hypothetical protein
MAVINGNDGDNPIISPAGNDSISGFGGNDVVYVNEGMGVDTIDGGAGSDWLSASNGGNLGVLVALGDRAIPLGIGSLSNGYIINLGGAGGTLCRSRTPPVGRERMCWSATMPATI